MGIGDQSTSNLSARLIDDDNGVTTSEIRLRLR